MEFRLTINPRNVTLARAGSKPLDFLLQSPSSPEKSAFFASIAMLVMEAAKITWEEAGEIKFTLNVKYDMK